VGKGNIEEAIKRRDMETNQMVRWYVIKRDDIAKARQEVKKEMNIELYLGGWKVNSRSYTLALEETEMNTEDQED